MVQQDLTVTLLGCQQPTKFISRDEFSEVVYRTQDLSSDTAKVQNKTRESGPNITPWKELAPNFNILKP